MPFKSRAQSKFMHWANEHPEESGVPAKVSGEFISAQHGRSLKNLPERVQHKAEGGAVYPSVFRW